MDKKYAGSCPHCGKLIEVKDTPLSTCERAVMNNRMERYGIELFNRRKAIFELTQKLEQREKFIDDIFAELENSNSKSTIVSVLLTRCKEQINGQKLGVL